MNAFQINLINGNLRQLYSCTVASVYLLDFFTSKGTLSEEEVQRIESMEYPMKRTRELYDILKNKHGGFEDLIEGLEKDNQSGALQILRRNLPCQKYSMRTDKNPRRKRETEPERVEPWEFQPFNDYLELDEKHDYSALASLTDIAWGHKRNSAIPSHFQRPPHKRIIYDTTLFNLGRYDRFVFKSISMGTLKCLIGTTTIKGSGEQLCSLNCRFILLENPKHWNDLQENATSPIHLITYINADKIFTLEESKGYSEFLEQCMRQQANQIKHPICSGKYNTGRGISYVSEEDTYDEPDSIYSRNGCIQEATTRGLSCYTQSGQTRQNAVRGGTTPNNSPPRLKKTT